MTHVMSVTDDETARAIVVRVEGDNNDGTFRGTVVSSTEPTKPVGFFSTSWVWDKFYDYFGTVPVDGDNPDD